MAHGTERASHLLAATARMQIKIRPGKEIAVRVSERGQRQGEVKNWANSETAVAAFFGEMGVIPGRAECRRRFCEERSVITIYVWAIAQPSLRSVKTF